ncbi:HD-GYP domain-containing protein [Thalassotalea marina]|uniref:Phosphodiesterase n=1 Tax=Thalassotalea marina TaxID=1673741 RepID=A0A919BD60_9GAMM|nr:HD-GYP domain-containing protein [Thalassotalea marina]GHF82660.1 phosphodiesterase [Thalassotalea marina]
MIQELSITDLKVGHFVIKIAKQKGKYHLTHADYIKSDLVIKNLIAKGVESVMVDLEKSKLAKTSTTTKKKSIIADVYEAKKLFDESKEIQRKVFADAVNGRPLDLEAITAITESTLKEIFRNSDALACVINIRNKDDYLLEHSVSVSVLITIFAKYLQIDKHIVKQLAIGGFLHDVGKIMIPEEVLNKPDKLTVEEFELMKSHVVHSIDTIKATPGISDISLEVAALHHEKLDGKGYPYNIPGDQISKYGRIIAICDIFDALTAARCYKDGYDHGKAFGILRSLVEKNHLDGPLVESFINCMGAYPLGSLVELNSRKIAFVEQHNRQEPSKPVVKSFYNAASKEYYDDVQLIDLSVENDYIVKGVSADELSLDMNKVIEFLLKQG